MRDYTGVSGATAGGLAKLTPAPATRWTPEVGNAIVLELRNLITGETGGGVALDPDDDSQVLTAILAMITRAVGVDIGDSTLSLGGLFSLKWGTVSGSFVEQSVHTEFPTPFPTACFGVLPVTINVTDSNVRDVWPQLVGCNADGFTLRLQRSGGGGNTDTSDGFFWVALGN
ncbi:hypothetical protein BH09PSE4_BH09PSE4_17920 [soil metagenome]